MTVEVVKLDERPLDWDEKIRLFAGKTLFHESCWLDHVASIHRGSRIVYAELRFDGRAAGYLVGVYRRYGPVRVLGSPLPGTGTNYMGPLVDPAVPLEQVITAINKWCRRTLVMHVELSHPALDALDHRATGLTPHPSVTHVVPLESGESAAWSAMKGTCRNRIRKAEKMGVQVEVTDDPSVADHFYEQYVEVYGKQGLVLPYGVERGKSLLEHLKPAGRVLPIWVKHEGEIVAAGLFPFDEHAIYFWGAASWMRFQHLCPNELLHWSVMKLALERNIPAYNMCGGTSQFKDKFGGTDVPYVRYSKSFVPGLSAARGIYRALHGAALRVRGIRRGRIERPPAPASSAKEE